jgi:hypothetical protein
MEMIKTILIAETLLIAGMLVVTTSPAFGALTFDEDMEQYATNTVIVTGTPTTIPGSSWFFQAFGGTASNLPTATVIADPTGAGHGNVLDYINPFPAGGTGWITSIDALGAAPSQNLVVDFDLYTVPHGNTSDQISHTIETLTRLTATDALIDGDTAEYAVDEGTGYVQRAIFNPGEWYHIREIAYGPGSADGPAQTFDVRITRESDGAVFLDTTGFAWKTSQPDVQATKFGSIGRSGFQIYIDNLTINDVIPVTPITLTNVVVTDTRGVSFQSVSNKTYRLQSTPDLVSSNFSDTGAIAIGDGGGMTLFDPGGTSTSKNYRVRQN